MPMGNWIWGIVSDKGKEGERNVAFATKTGNATESLSSDVEVFGSLMVEWDVDIEVILVGSWIGVGVCCACSAKGSGEGVCRLVSSSGIFVGIKWGYVSRLRI